jgi:thioesterase domain-containing protein
VAFEMAQQLVRAGEEVGLLALFDTRAPGYPTLRRNAPARFHLFRLVGNPFPQPPERRWSEMRREMFKLWTQRLEIRWRKFAGRELSQESLYFDFLTVAFAAKRRYRPLPYPRPITLFRVPAQPSNEIYATDPLLGWSRLAAGGLEVIDVEGFHGQPMFREPYVAGSPRNSAIACARRRHPQARIRAPSRASVSARRARTAHCQSAPERPIVENLASSPDRTGSASSAIADPSIRLGAGLSPTTLGPRRRSFSAGCANAAPADPAKVSNRRCTTNRTRTPAPR